MNDKGILKKRFRWQPSYGAFSYSKRDVDRVYKYIENQEQHHRKQRFLDEYLDLLEEHGIDYDERHLFQPLI